MPNPDLAATLRSGHAIQRIAHFAFAQVFFRIPERARRRWNRRGRYACPVCGSAVLRFLRIHRPYHQFCPVCRSLQRHRLLWLFLQRKTPLFDAQPRRILHFAPEPGLARRLGELPGTTYVSADLYDPQAMARIDITAIPYEEASFDFILCSHVLEHIPDDRQAMREVRRVMTPNGLAAIVVPVAGATTDEDLAVTDPLERERRFGQADHVRVYGWDVGQRLRNAGLDAQPYRAADVASGEEIARYGMSPSDIIWLCRRT